MDMHFILASIGVFLVTILVLVVILLVAKKFLAHNPQHPSRHPI